MKIMRCAASQRLARCFDTRRLVRCGIPKPWIGTLEWMSQPRIPGYTHWERNGLSHTSEGVDTYLLWPNVVGDCAIDPLGVPHQIDPATTDAQWADWRAHGTDYGTYLPCSYCPSYARRPIEDTSGIKTQTICWYEEADATYGYGQNGFIQASYRIPDSLYYHETPFCYPWFDPPDTQECWKSEHPFWYDHFAGADIKVVQRYEWRTWIKVPGTFGTAAEFQASALWADMPGVEIAISLSYPGRYMSGPVHHSYHFCYAGGDPWPAHIDIELMMLPGPKYWLNWSLWPDWKYHFQLPEETYQAALSGYVDDDEETPCCINEWGEWRNDTAIHHTSPHILISPAYMLC